MKLLLDRPVSVAYSQIYVEQSDSDYLDFDAAYKGQSNGLCGAAQGGRLLLITGTHTGTVNFCAELHDSAPELAEKWEEVVEASFRLDREGVYLQEWGGSGFYELDLTPGTYRVRYLARGMNIESVKYEQRAPAEEWPQEEYCLQFWPAPCAPDRIVKLKTEVAKNWHSAYAKG